MGKVLLTCDAGTGRLPEWCLRWVAEQTGTCFCPESSLLSQGTNVLSSILCSLCIFRGWCSSRLLLDKLSSRCKSPLHCYRKEPKGSKITSCTTYWIGFFFQRRAWIVVCWILWYNKFRLLSFWLSFAFFGNWFCHRFRGTPFVGWWLVHQRWGRQAWSFLFLHVFWGVLGSIQFHVVAVVLRMQFPVTGVGGVVAARVLGRGHHDSYLLRGSLWHQRLIDDGCHMLISHTPFVLVESCPWARVLLLRGFWGGGLGWVALLGTCFRRPGGCRAFAIKMWRLLWCRWLFWYFFFWILFSIYTFLKSLFDIIWAWGKIDNRRW